MIYHQKEKIISYPVYVPQYVDYNMFPLNIDEYQLHNMLMFKQYHLIVFQLNQVVLLIFPVYLQVHNQVVLLMFSVYLQVHSSVVLLMFSVYLQVHSKAVMCVILLQLHLQLPEQSVPITTNVVSSNPAHGEVYSIHYVIKFVSDLRHVDGFIPVSSTNKTDPHVITEIFLKVAINTITQPS